MYPSLQQGIESIQAGNHDEGARLIRIALKKEPMPDKVRAVAYVWLAETSADLSYKRQCYNDALKVDPGNPEIQQRLDALLAASLPLPPRSVPEMPTPPQPQAPVVPAAAVTPQPQPMVQAESRPVVGIFNGPNGPGSGFFVGPGGLIATTRYVVGGLEMVSVELEPGIGVPGNVVRAYPDVDVALVQIEAQRAAPLPNFTPLHQVPENLPLNVMVYNRDTVLGTRRSTRRIMEAHWFPTTIERTGDAGGNPVFDDHQFLLGMLTRNTSRTSGYLYGVHIGTIRKRVEDFLWEKRSQANKVYCPCCGGLSQAAAMGLFYCEMCGGMLPHAASVTRRPQPQGSTFYEHGDIKCPNPECGSRAGFYNGRCLRCGIAPVR